MTTEELEQHIATIRTGFESSDSQARSSAAYAAQVIAGVLAPAQAAAQPQAGGDTLDTIIGVLGQLVEKRHDREAVELPADVPHLPWRAKA